MGHPVAGIGPMTARVMALASDRTHRFSKTPAERIVLVEGRGVEGDAHFGETVQHLSRVRRDPSQPNLRQVHLIHRELLDELAERGFSVAPGDLGENVTTQGLDLLGLSRGARLHLGETAVLEVTGLRNPCIQIDCFQSGLMAAVLGRDANDDLVRKAGVMAIVLRGGPVAQGDAIRVEPPAGAFAALEPV